MQPKTIESFFNFDGIYIGHALLLFVRGKNLGAATYEMFGCNSSQ